MADQYGGSFGGYTDVAGVIAAGSQTEVQANIAKLKALILDPSVQSDPTQTPYPGPGPSPDFDRIAPALAQQLNKEIDDLAAAIAAAPTA